MAELLNDWYNQKATTDLPKPTGMLPSVRNWQNTPDQTVQGQVENVIKADSPIMTLARTEADQQSQKRGLLNSSIGIGAAQDSVFRTALPIAQSDASQAARVAGYNVDTENKANQFNTTNQFSKDERIAKDQFSKEERIANNQYDFDKTIYTEGQTNTRQTQNIYSGLAKGYAESVDVINRDPNMTQQAKTYAIKQLYDTHSAQLKLMSNVGKIPDVSVLLTPMKQAKAPKAGYRNYVPPKAAAAGGGKVICTRCHALGYMDTRTYIADDIYGELLKLQRPDFIGWYWGWATYVVDAMHCKTLLSRLFTSLAWHVGVKHWSRQMSHEMGFNNKGSWLGKSYMVMADWIYRVTKNA
jgi:hypothetical protein